VVSTPTSGSVEVNGSINELSGAGYRGGDRSTSASCFSSDLLPVLTADAT
jgi:hypothetical protein